MHEFEEIRTVYLDTLERWRGTPLVKVLVGMRRVGKSTLLLQWSARLKSHHGVPDSHLLLIERDALEHADMEDWKALRSLVDTRFSGLKGPKVLLIDEVQLIQGWEKVINALHKQGDVDIYLTGSNAHLLSTELSTLLSGRWVGIPILPFSYAETLSIRKQSGHSPEEFQRWLRWGGIPTIHHLPDDSVLLTQTLEAIHNTVVLRDVVSRHSVRNVAHLEQVVRFFFDQIGNLVSAKRIADHAKSQHLRISMESVQNYLHHLEGACALSRVRRYDIRGRRHLEFPEKIYVTDHGIRNAMLRRTTEDIGALLENAVHQELVRRGWTVSVGKVGDWEIDFVAEREGRREYFQVAYQLGNPETVEREFRSLIAIPDNHPKTILSLDDIDLGRDGIRHKHLARWLLEPHD